MLATRVEKVLLSVMDANVITGVKVLRASPGSVVVDVQLSHLPNISPQQAFESFVNSVIESQSITSALRIKTHISPSWEEMLEKEIVWNTTSLVVFLAVFVPLALVMGIAAVFFVRRRRNQRYQVTKASREIEAAVAESFDNVAVSIEELSGAFDDPALATGFDNSALSIDDADCGASTSE